MKQTSSDQTEWWFRLDRKMGWQRVMEGRPDWADALEPYLREKFFESDIRQLLTLQLFCPFNDRLLFAHKPSGGADLVAIHELGRPSFHEFKGAGNKFDEGVAQLLYSGARFYERWQYEISHPFEPIATPANAEHQMFLYTSGAEAKSFQFDPRSILDHQYFQGTPDDLRLLREFIELKPNIKLEHWDIQIAPKQGVRLARCQVYSI